MYTIALKTKLGKKMFFIVEFSSLPYAALFVTDGAHFVSMSVNKYTYGGVIIGLSPCYIF